MIERHAAFLMCYNQLHLTKEAMASLLAQDIGPLEILVVNNGSTDGTREWLDSLVNNTDDCGPHKLRISHHETNQSPVLMFNHAAQMLWDWGHEKFLAVANDVVLPANAYRLMAQWPRGIVTASQTTEKDFVRVTETKAASECTPMAIAMFRKWVWDALVTKDGYFYDEGYFNYASDCDLALRISSCGIRGVQLDLPYYHAGSATLRLAPPEERREMDAQANADRAYFEQKWGFACTAYEYGACALDINFRWIPQLKRYL
jgi:glycosyltransferase involved in cell wall biosynthesis